MYASPKLYSRVVFNSTQTVGAYSFNVVPFSNSDEGLYPKHLWF